MLFRRACATVLLLLALCHGAGCSRSDDTALVPELDDPNFKHAKQLQRHGRDGEALNAYLKVIETRGTRAAPESHLEAGAIYLNHAKNPIEAIHHFNQYLLLRPNSVQAQLVKEQVSAATREFALRLPARPFDDQSVRLAENNEIETLRRENEELRAELATLRGGGGPPVNRFARPIPPASPSSRPGQAQAVAPVDSLISVAPVPAPGATPAAPVRTPPATTPDRRFAVGVPAAPSRPSAPATAPARPPPTRSATAAGRTHTVAPRESLWSIARKYYGDSASSARVNAIFEANRNVMSSPTDLKIGMTLRIP